MEQVQVLLNNICIEKCGGPWGGSIVLSKKLIRNIFITLMISYEECVSLIERLILLPNLSSSLFRIVMML